MLDWEGLFKRYVWDTDRTPYFTPVARLTQAQANYEILAYALFMGVLFTVAALGALSEKSLFGRSPLVGLYAFTVVSASVILYYAKLFWAAVYVAAAPAAGLVAVAAYGFMGDRARMDSIIVGGLLILLMLYAPRILQVVRSYPDMPEGVAPERRRKLFK